MSRTRKPFLFLLVFAVAESSLSTTSLAYKIGGNRWPADIPCSGDACLNQPFTLRYTYLNMFDGGMKMPDGSPLPNSLIRASIEEALQVWTTAIPVNFVEVPLGSPAQIVFRHFYYNGADPPNGPPTTKALSTCLGLGVGCQVQFDDGDPWQEVGEISKPDVLGATIHEVGHTLGLDHSDDPVANMFRIFHRTTGLGTGQLFDDDIKGIHFLYGSGAGSLTTLGVPEPATCLIAAAMLSALPFLHRNRIRRIRSGLSASLLHRHN